MLVSTSAHNPSSETILCPMSESSDIDGVYADLLAEATRVQLMVDDTEMMDIDEDEYTEV